MQVKILKCFSVYYFITIFLKHYVELLYNIIMNILNVMIAIQLLFY